MYEHNIWEYMYTGCPWSLYDAFPSQRSLKNWKAQGHGTFYFQGMNFKWLCYMLHHFPSKYFMTLYCTLSNTYSWLSETEKLFWVTDWHERFISDIVEENFGK